MEPKTRRQVQTYRQSETRSQSEFTFGYLC
jgi:hypothetical protein